MLTYVEKNGKCTFNGLIIKARSNAHGPSEETPIDVARSMVGAIPSSAKRVLVVAKFGNEIRALGEAGFKDVTVFNAGNFKADEKRASRNDMLEAAMEQDMNVTILSGDFLEASLEGIEPFDVVLQNPPFGDYKNDRKFLRFMNHVSQFLKADGYQIAVIPGKVTLRDEVEICSYFEFGSAKIGGRAIMLPVNVRAQLLRTVSADLVMPNVKATQYDSSERMIAKLGTSTPFIRFAQQSTELSLSDAYAEVHVTADEDPFVSVSTVFTGEGIEALSACLKRGGMQLVRDKLKQHRAECRVLKKNHTSGGRRRHIDWVNEAWEQFS